MDKIKTFRTAGCVTSVRDAGTTVWGERMSALQREAAERFFERFFPSLNTLYPVPKGVKVDAFFRELGEERPDIPEPVLDGTAAFILKSLIEVSGQGPKALLPDTGGVVWLSFSPAVRGSGGRVVMPLPGSEITLTMEVPEDREFYLRGAVVDAKTGQVSAFGLMEGDAEDEPMTGAQAVQVIPDDPGLLVLNGSLAVKLPEEELGALAGRMDALWEGIRNRDGGLEELVKKNEEISACRAELISSRWRHLEDAAGLILGLGLPVQICDCGVSGPSWGNMDRLYGKDGWASLIRCLESKGRLKGIPVRVVPESGASAGSVVRRGEDVFEVSLMT